MRTILYALSFFFITTVANAQSKQYGPFPPLGIEWPDIPIAGSVGSDIYNRGIQSIARTKLLKPGSEYVNNKDATRFLEKAVSENNLENAAKLLKAGASAFISYEMIDKKQYEMIDLMYKDNPKLIRYSQLLHYACAKSDSTMIDFLIARNASLDLNGYYVNKDKWGRYSVMCMWNSDPNYMYTPADVALNSYQIVNLEYIIKKYHKYPTIYGFSQLLTMKTSNNGIRDFFNVEGFLPNYCMKWKVDYTFIDAINFGYHYLSGDKGDVDSYYKVILIVSQIAACRKANNNKDKEYFEVLKLMLDKGANPNCQTDNGAAWRAQRSVGINVSNYVDTTPMYIALTNANMMDVVKLLRSKGASMTTTANGKTVSILKLPKVRDEYKEYFMLEGIQ